MKKKKLIFFLATPFDEVFLKKHLISEANKYFDIKYYSIQSFYRKKKEKRKKNYFIINEYKDLIKYLNTHKSKFGIMIGNDQNHLNIAKICKENFNMKITYMNINLVPETRIEYNLKTLLYIVFSKKFFYYLYRLNYKIKLLLISLFRKNTNIKFDFSIIGGKFGQTIPTVLNSKKILQLHSYDLEESQKYKIKKKNYTVFLDEDMYNHRDYKLLNNKKYVSKIYFKEINNFFNFFEKKFKTRILISLHPRTKNIGLYKKYFNQRKCLINKSHELVSGCKYVLLHPSTTALNLPIIYKKPLIFLTTNELLEKFELKLRAEGRKQYLNQPFINLSNYQKHSFPENFNNIDKKGYKNYMHDFIGTKNIYLKKKMNIWRDFYKNVN